MEKLELHRFQVKDKRFILNIKTSQFFVIDDITNKILEMYENEVNKEAIITQLQESHPNEEIMETFNSLDKYLFLNDYEEIEYEGKDFYGDTIKSNLNMQLKGIMLLVSQNCNLSCKYCFGIDGSYGLKSQMMDYHTAKKAVDFLFKNSDDNECVYLCFFGGEPLLNFNVIKETIEYAYDKCKENKKDLELEISTNGTLLNNEIIDFFIEKGVNTMISIDGNREMHDGLRCYKNNKGSYNMVISNAINAFSKGLKGISARVTITKRNTNIRSIVKSLTAIGFSNIIMTPAATTDKNIKLECKDIIKIKKEYEYLSSIFLESVKRSNPIKIYDFLKLLKIIHKPIKNIYPCGACRTLLAISANGDIYDCHRFIGKKGHKLGNVSYGISNFKLISRHLANKVEMKESCSSCWARYYCGGGCYHECETYCGDFEGSNDPLICEIFKNNLELCFWLYTKIKEEGLGLKFLASS